MTASNRCFRIVLTVFLVLALCALAGCGDGSGKTAGTSGNPEPQPKEDTATGVASGASSDDQIPPGREIAEGGGGPVQYTFREEWRRALAVATEWKSGAYLVSAVGDMINDEGIPSSWRLTFTDDSDSATVLVDIDPWGKVTQKREFTGDDAKSQLGDYPEPISYAVIDSDEAVRIGKEAIGAKYDLSKTKDPRVVLNHSVLDGSGPYWQYSLFYQSTAEYVSARIDALTGKVVPNEEAGQ